MTAALASLMRLASRWPTKPDAPVIKAFMRCFGPTLSIRGGQAGSLVRGAGTHCAGWSVVAVEPVSRYADGMRGSAAVMGSADIADIAPVPFEPGDPWLLARWLGVLAALLLVSAAVAGGLWLRRARARASARRARLWAIGLAIGAALAGGGSAAAGLLKPEPKPSYRSVAAARARELRLLEQEYEALSQRAQALRHSVEVADSEAERAELSQQLRDAEAKLRVFAHPAPNRGDAGCNCPPGDPLCVCP